MTPKRKKRLAIIGLVLGGVAVAAALMLNAFQQNLLFFYTPTQLMEENLPRDRNIRLGGLVAAGSVVRQPDGLTVEFDITDNQNSLRVRYTGILPDLFREGQGIVALGRMGKDGIFKAEEVLAKHDENYMPPDVAEALEEAHKKATGQAR